MIDFYQASCLIRFVTFMAGLAVVFRVRLKPAPVFLVGLSAAILWAATIIRLYPILGMDYRIFWEVGRHVWAGRDPYAADCYAQHQFLNPPRALPVFAAFALLPSEREGASP